MNSATQPFQDSRGMTDRADVLEQLLRELITEVRGLRADLHAKSSSLTRTDRRTLERLLPAIALLFPAGEIFTAKELIAHSAPGFRILRGRMSTRSLGRLLTRAEGVVIDGLIVERTGTEANVALYGVKPC